VWKRLSREERLAAATHFWSNPPEETAGSALAALVNARHLRPQVARALPLEDKARALAGVLDPGEALAGSLLVTLHLGERREILRTFLDAAGLRHEDGILSEDEDAQPLSEEAARSGVSALGAAFTRAQVETYLNTLWLQDRERWRVLEKSEEWL
jgi:hypothetical protein